MKQQVVVGIVAVGLLSAAVWLGLERSRGGETPPSAVANVPARPFARATPSQGLRTLSGTQSTSAPAARRSQAAPDPDIQPATSDSLEPPSVDAAEPAERKFARGGHEDPTEQN
jgi:hypothetical protein